MILRRNMKTVSSRQKKKGRSDGVPISFGSYTREEWPMSVSMFSYSASNVNRQNGQFCLAFHGLKKGQSVSAECKEMKCSTLSIISVVAITDATKHIEKAKS